MKLLRGGVEIVASGIDRVMGSDQAFRKNRVHQLLHGWYHQYYEKMQSLATSQDHRLSIQDELTLVHDGLRPQILALFAKLDRVKHWREQHFMAIKFSDQVYVTRDGQVINLALITDEAGRRNQRQKMEEQKIYHVFETLPAIPTVRTR